MKKINIALLLNLLFLGAITTNTASAYSYYSSSSIEYLWLPFIIIGIYAAVFIVWILVAYWVYKDAKKRGENAILWAILVIFGGLIAIILWFILRPPIGGKKSTPDRICINCGRGIPFDARICPYCGKKFEQ